MSVQGVPPSIDGYTYVRSLGGGGFADVFLYDQHHPERRVAIKVLRQGVDDEDLRRLFSAEANLMAKVSSHPNIVEIHGAGVASDGRPYLVMAHFPLQLFGEASDRSPLPVDQVLEHGIKLACAVETAHQARIIHRDIKPANVLVSRFGEPALTDFGISGTQGEGGTEESRGFSPPYAPPEILSNAHPGDARSDVYSLGATLWTLLAGHAPFERLGESNKRADYTARGLNDPVPPFPAGRVPARFELVLRQALEKQPDRRPQTAKAFAELLQGVQREIGQPVTPLTLMVDRAEIESAVAEVVVAAEKTKKGSGIVVDLDATAPRGSLLVDRPQPKRDHAISTPGPLPLPVQSDRPAVVSASVPSSTAGSTVVVPGRSQPAPPTREPTIESKRTVSRSLWLIAAIAGVGVVGAIALASRGGGGSVSSTTTAFVDTVVNPGEVGNGNLTAVDGITSTRDGANVTFSWSYPTTDGVQFVVQRVDAGSTDDQTVVDTPAFTVTADAATSPCIVVTAFVAGRSSAEPSQPVCAT